MTNRRRIRKLLLTIIALLLIVAAVALYVARRLEKIERKA